MIFLKKNKAGIALIPAFVFAALSFMGCPTESEPGAGDTKVPKTWSDVSIEGLEDGFWGVAYGNGVFVASARSTGNEAPNHVYWSADGVTWTEATTDYQNLMTNNKKQTTAFLNDKFVIFEGSSGVNNNGKWIQKMDTIKRRKSLDPGSYQRPYRGSRGRIRGRQVYIRRTGRKDSCRDNFCERDSGI